MLSNPPDPAIDSPRVRALIVDDNLDSAESLAELLQVWSYEVRVCHRGEDAIEQARVFRPSVILLDIGLPDLDGYGVAARLREEGLAGELLVALTGYGDREDRERSREAGFDHHIIKPVDAVQLKRLLQSVG